MGKCGNRLQYVTYDKLWQRVAKCGKMWQHVRTKNKRLQHVGDLWPFCENPVCPDPVWEPVDTQALPPNSSTNILQYPFVPQ